ncbi:hydratase [Psychromonas sp. RZ22]|uniref:hydratase n=1 Tax=Psychromonas algarum TaxID=2555643 RepID=UPI0010680B7E|nr:hydratase [Psychromonas sp. RZ22]TEW54147.1 hydratase [Psychromonas sp. RZ22]
MTEKTTQTLNKEACLKAAQEFLTRREDNHRGDALPADCRPANLDDALAIQVATVEASGKSIAGWKCLVPLNPEQMVVGPVLEGTVQQGAECLVKSTEAGKTLIEPEIAFVLGADLPAREDAYTNEEIDNAIASTHMALELLQRRYAPNDDLTFFDKLADCLLNQGIFVGPEITKAQAYDAATIKLSINGESYDGKHPNLSAHTPVYWLINFMRERGVSFKKGQTIITGSYAGAIEVVAQATEIEYEGLGKYQVTFKEF